MIMAGWRMAIYRDNSSSKKFAEVIVDMEGASEPLRKQNFKPQRVKIKRRSTSQQTWEVDVSTESVSIQHQSVR